MVETTFGSSHVTGPPLATTAPPSFIIATWTNLPPFSLEATNQTNNHDSHYVVSIDTKRWPPTLFSDHELPLPSTNLAGEEEHHKRRCKTHLNVTIKNAYPVSRCCQPWKYNHHTHVKQTIVVAFLHETQQKPNEGKRNLIWKREKSDTCQTLIGQ